MSALRGEQEALTAFCSVVIIIWIGPGFAGPEE